LCIHRILGFDRQFLVVETGAPAGPARQEVHHMKRSLSKFWHDESGATAIEYGLIAAAIALAIIAILNGIGLHLADMLAALNASLK
jgi:pilus assembly protein Flp/PilA